MIPQRDPRFSGRWFLLQLHRWLALVALLPLVLAGASGAVLTFESELDRLLNPTLWSVEPHGEPLAWQAIIDVVRDRYPDDPVTSLRLPASDWLAAEVSLGSGLLVYTDPFDGAIRGARRRSDIGTARIHRFHTSLLMGDVGSTVMGISALALVVLSLTGLVLWWRTKVGSFHRLSGKRFWFDFHSTLGIYGLVFWLALGATGAMMTFEQFVEPAIYQITDSVKIKAPQLESLPAGGRRPITIDEAIAAAREALPGASLAMIRLPRQPQGVFVAYLKFPEDATPAGRSHVYIDRYSGLPLWVSSTRAMDRGSWLWAQHRSWHTGDWLGWTTRLLACLASGLLVVQAVGGAILFARGRRKPSSQAPLF